MSATGFKYVDPKVISKISRLDLKARLVVEGFISGQHRSPYHGFSVEFASHREYVPGDEIKHIDWKVWARGDRFYIKQYEEETNLRTTLLLDASKSMRYGTASPGGVSKFDYAATAAASLAYLLHQQQDAVGLVAFDTQVRCNLPSSTHPSHLKLLFHELEKIQPDNKTEVAEVFHRLAEEIHQRGLVVLLSDLLVDADSLLTSLRHFRHRRHEVVIFHILHDDEMNFPFQDNTLFRGMEVPAQIMAEPRALRKSYLEALERFLSQVRRVCSACGIDYVPVNTSTPLDAVLSAYLVFRHKTLRGSRRR